MPRFAPVIKIVLFSMFIPSPFYGCSFCLQLRIACRGRIRPTAEILRFTLFPPPEAARQRSRPCGIALPSGTYL